MPAWLARDATADGGGEGIDLWTRCAAKAAVWKRRAVLELVVVWCVGFGGWVYPTPNVVISGGTGMPLMLAGL